MKDSYNNIDELLKQSLEGYKKAPSVGVWNRISVRLLFAGKGIYFFILALLLAVLSGYFIFQNNSNHEGDTLITQNEMSALVPGENYLEKKHENNVNTNESSISSVNSNNYKTEQDSKTISEEVIPSTSVSTSMSNNDLDSEILSISNANEVPVLFVSNENEIIQYTNYPGLERLDIQHDSKLFEQNAFSGFYVSPKYATTIYPRASFLNIHSVAMDDYGRQRLWSYGLHITPEIIFTNDENNSKKTALSLDITGIYGVKDWFFQFGVGVGLSEDNGTYRIDYAQYDSIGYYYEVTGFDINPETGQPIFNTNVEGVYDTVLYNEIQTTDNLYTYLRIPIFGGLKLHENKRFSVSLKAGGVYSILLKENEPGTNYANENATWVKITNDTPERIQSNFQLSLALGLSYRLSNRLSLSAEPAYNYYINSVYQQRYSSKSPWSLGLRAGVVFQF